MLWLALVILIIAGALYLLNYKSPPPHLKPHSGPAKHSQRIPDGTYKGETKVLGFVHVFVEVGNVQVNNATMDVSFSLAIDIQYFGVSIKCDTVTGHLTKNDDYSLKCVLDMDGCFKENISKFINNSEISYDHENNTILLKNINVIVPHVSSINVEVVQLFHQST